MRSIRSFSLSLQIQQRLETALSQPELRDYLTALIPPEEGEPKPVVTDKIGLQVSDYPQVWRALGHQGGGLKRQPGKVNFKLALFIEPDDPKNADPDKLLNRLNAAMDSPVGKVAKDLINQIAAINRVAKKRWVAYNARKNNLRPYNTSKVVEVLLNLALDNSIERVASLDHGLGSTKAHAGESKDQSIKSKARTAPKVRAIR